MQSPPGTQETALTREMPPVEIPDSSPLPPAPTLISAQGDACASCGALVAADQRYCIECGERRGEPRLPFMDGRTAAEPPPPEVITPAYPGAYLAPPAPPKSKWNSGIALLATIGLLLLAMGVGVLIGNNGDSKQGQAQQPVIVGGAVTAATGASGATGAADAKASASTASAGDEKAGVDADAVAKKNGVKLAPKDVDLGEKCEKGSVGCSDSGEFDGEYFK